MADRGQQKKEQPVNEADKRLAADWLKRIETAVGRFDKDFKRFARNRKLLRGVNPENETASGDVRSRNAFRNLSAVETSR